MIQPTRDNLRGLLPHLNDDELDAVHERLRRYVSLAVEIARNGEHATQHALTESPATNNVNAGQVDPSTFPTSLG